eukprot:5788877-Prymnesium_polylepis.2
MRSTSNDSSTSSPRLTASASARAASKRALSEGLICCVDRRCCAASHVCTPLRVTAAPSWVPQKRTKSFLGCLESLFGHGWTVAGHQGKRPSRAHTREAMGKTSAITRGYPAIREEQP